MVAMKFSIILSLGLLLSSASAQRSCPGADSLYYRATSEWTYEVACGKEYRTPTNVSTTITADEFACAEVCDNWDSRGNTPKCLAGSFDHSKAPGDNNCFLKGGLTGERANGNVTTMVLGKKLCNVCAS